MTYLIDSVPFDYGNHDNYYYLIWATWWANDGFYQTFTSSQVFQVATAMCYLMKSGSVPDFHTCQAFIYAHSGVYGTSGIPINTAFDATNNALASSDTISCLNLSTAMVPTFFNFSNAITLSANTPYVLYFGVGREQVPSYPNYKESIRSLAYLGTGNSTIHDGNYGYHWTRYNYTTKYFEAHPEQEMIFSLYGVGEATSRKPFIFYSRGEPMVFY